MSSPFVIASSPQLMVTGQQQIVQQPLFRPQLIGSPVQQIPVHQAGGQAVQFIPQQFHGQHSSQSMVRPGSPIARAFPPQYAAESYLSLGNGKMSASLGYMGSGNTFDATQQIQSKLSQHRGVHGYHPDNLPDTVHYRNGGNMHHFTTADYAKSLENHPSHISEHIQRRPHVILDQYQDSEGLDIIRVQATRLSNLLDRIEILEKEVERQAELLNEKDSNLEFWTKQFKQLEHNRENSIETIDTFQNPDVDKLTMFYFEDKSEIEKKVTLKLREIEDCNEQIAYWKSHCIPNDDQGAEVKKLQNKQEELSELNRELSQKLVVVEHEQRTESQINQPQVYQAQQSHFQFRTLDQ